MMSDSKTTVCTAECVQNRELIQSIPYFFFFSDAGGISVLSARRKYSKYLIPCLQPLDFFPFLKDFPYSLQRYGFIAKTGKILLLLHYDNN